MTPSHESEAGPDSDCVAAASLNPGPAWAGCKSLHERVTVATQPTRKVRWRVRLGRAPPGRDSLADPGPAGKLKDRSPTVMMDFEGHWRLRLKFGSSKS